MVFNTGAAPSGRHCSGSCIQRGRGGLTATRLPRMCAGVLEVSESTLYPVLRRLQKDECLETYDREFAGRNRRYYKVTEKGMVQLNLYREEWKSYSTKISTLFEGGD